jgi:uncharacterized protein (TIGR02118 family)
MSRTQAEVDGKKEPGEGTMVRIVSLHKRPLDPEAYIRYYLDVHMPIVQKVPGLRKIRWGKVVGAAGGSQAPCWLISDVYFDDIHALESALESPEMEAALADLSNFVRDGDVQIMFCEAQDISPLAGVQ